ncbi:unnamed protein product [Camellia sinensis]
MEITVISAEGLKNKSSALFSSSLRPFVTLTVPPPPTTTNGDKPCHVYKSRVDDEGDINPTWGDKFHLPIDATFLYKTHSFIYLQLYTKRVMGGQTQLGWCQIPAADIVDGLSPPGLLRRLSYRLRERDGSRGHGVVNIAVKLDSSISLNSNLTHLPEMGLCQKTVIGVPVTMSPAASGVLDGSCNRNGSYTEFEHRKCTKSIKWSWNLEDLRELPLRCCDEVATFNTVLSIVM